MKKCMKRLCVLLKSCTASDVTETIKFLTETHCLNLDGSLESIRKMLTLVWSKDQSVVQAVRKAYETLYLDVALKPDLEPHTAIK
jgi:hypothetical protein